MLQTLPAALAYVYMLTVTRRLQRHNATATHNGTAQHGEAGRRGARQREAVRRMRRVPCWQALRRKVLQQGVQAEGLPTAQTKGAGATEAARRTAVSLATAAGLADQRAITSTLDTAPGLNRYAARFLNGRI